MKPVLAITWERHRRMNELSDWLGVNLRILESKHRGLRRYLALAWTTFWILARERPSRVFIQNPSLVLATLVLLLRPFFGRYRVVMDAHNEAVTPFSVTVWPIPWLARRAMRKADITIVTNEALAKIVRAAGGRPLVLPDRLPTAPIAPRAVPLTDELQVMVVATYAADEPITDILESARLLGAGYRFIFTGNPKKLSTETREGAPANVRFAGFVPEHDYWQLMADSHVMLDLTLKPNCLVCGAYEALALQKPMVLTGNPASRDLFERVALFPASERAADIAATLRELRTRYDALLPQLVAEGPRFNQRWTAAAAELRDALNDGPLESARGT
jgi:glycosyltransferase involved in cell wall biosynthesis